MGYASSLLGTNVVSSYLHIDNLRNDITNGKHFETAGTKYLQASHDGTNAKLVSSSGRLDLTSGSTFFRLHESAGTHYLSVEVGAGGGVTLGNSASVLNFAATTATTYFITAGTAYQVLVANANNTEYISFDCEKTVAGHGILRTTHNTNPMLLGADSARIRLGQGTNVKYDLEFYDAGAAQWVKVYVNNGAWVIAAV